LRGDFGSGDAIAAELRDGEIVYSVGH
jgi:hypothetical protein